ncbi:MAG: LptA/OstA family protein [Pseudomonadota bacterium]|nr:LptA/OstA family protein [Pseudomonadota bacterium]
MNWHLRPFITGALFSVLAAVLPGLTSSALAQSRVTSGGFDLTAQEGIAFDAGKGTYRATGEVQLVAGDWVVLADTVEARLGPDGRSVSSIEASGSVFVRSPQVTARCAVLTLRPDSGDVDLAGPGVVLQFDGSRLVTDGLLRLDTGAERFTLDGAFVLQWGEIRLSAEGGRGALDAAQLASIEASGSASLQGADWRAAAERLRFDEAASKVWLEGAAVVQQGDMVLSGAGLVYDLATGSLVLDGGAGGRISGALSGQ